MYYKRQLRVINETIQDLGDDISYCFMCHDALAAVVMIRGLQFCTRTFRPIYQFTVRGKKSSNVYGIKQNDFLSFTSLLRSIVVRRHVGNDNRKLDLRRNKRGRPISLELSQIHPTYRAPVLINITTKNDLFHRLPLIDSAYHGFYQLLISMTNKVRSLVVSISFFTDVKGQVTFLGVLPLSALSLLHYAFIDAERNLRSSNKESGLEDPLGSQDLAVKSRPNLFIHSGILNARTIKPLEQRRGFEAVSQVVKFSNHCLLPNTTLNHPPILPTSKLITPSLPPLSFTTIIISPSQTITTLQKCLNMLSPLHPVPTPSRLSPNQPNPLLPSQHNNSFPNPHQLAPSHKISEK
ncbi:hypothetical protein PR048_011784 [Dryococelus australis]|uniref:Uncharacterized protein n=1 Tax=Dryococelus australis TaxID=614101 RepID=A0ABQ9HMH5_9NEOP|nr:hypothetical protein PR048_011784 [Dryococelus australis]